MTDTETKVVKLEFDGSKFDKNVKKSSKTLDEFKEKLRFEDVSKSADVFIKKLKSLDIVVASVVKNITDRVIDLGIQMTKSLSIDNISSGWDKFGLKATSVATIAAQKIKIAGKELGNYEEKLDAINEQLDKLNWFTDETSYNFTDMVNTIGKFTAAGVDLDKSVDAMMGIANWAALSGQNASTASRAMYQLAQAMAKGNIQLIDWRSIETANMATMEFKQLVLDTAAAMGQLTKQGDQFISKTGKKITALNFSETLSDKWFTSDILVSTLERYSSAVQRIYEISEETGLTASQVMEEYADELDKFGLKAFKAAQEARTFADALNSVKDAVSTGWMNTFEKIFGGYDESRKLWTDLANELYDVFAEGGNFRNQVLNTWKELGGRANLFNHGDTNQGAFWNIYDSIVAVINKFKEAKNEVFNPSMFGGADDVAKDMAHQLQTMTENVQYFTAKIKRTVTENKAFQGVLKGIFSIMKLVMQVMRGIRYALDPIVSVMKGVFSDILDRIGVFGSNLSILERSFGVIESIATSIAKVIEAILDVLDVRGNLNKFLDFIGSIFTGNFNGKSAAKGIVGFFDSIGESIKSFKRNVGDILNGNVKADMFGPLYNIVKGIVEFVKGVWELISSVSGIIGNVLEVIGHIFQAIARFINEIVEVGIDWKMLSTFSKTVLVLGGVAAIIFLLKILFETLQSVFMPFMYGFDTLADALYDWAKSKSYLAMSSIIVSIGETLLMIALSFAIIGKLDREEFNKGLSAIVILTSIIGLIVVAVMAINAQILKGENALTIWKKSTSQFGDTITDCFQEIKQTLRFGELAAFIASIGSAMIAVGLAFRIIGTMNDDEWRKGMATMVIFIGMITIVSLAASKADKSIDTKSVKKLGKSILSFSLAFRLLSTILIKFASVKTENLWSALGVFSVMTGVFTACVVLIDRFAKASEVTATGWLVSFNKEVTTKFDSINSIMLTLITSMILMSGILVMFSKVNDVGKLWAAFGLLSAMLTLMAAFTILISKFASKSTGTDSIKNATAGLIMMSGFVLLVGSVALSVASTSQLPLDKIVSSTVMLGLMLTLITGMVVALNRIGGNIRESTANMLMLVSFATLISVVALSLLVLKNIPIGTLLVSVAAIGVLIAAVVGSLALIKKLDINPSVMLSFSSSIAIFAGSLIILSVAIMALAMIPWQNMLQTLAVVGAALVVLIGASGLIKKFNADKAIIAFASAFVLLGAGLLLIAASMQVFSNSLEPFLNSVMNSMDLIIASMESMTEKLKEKGSSITEFFNTIGQIGLQILTDSIRNIVAAIVNLASELIPLFDEFFEKVKDPLKRIINNIYDIIIETLPNLLTILGIIFKWVIDFITDPENINNIVEGLFTLIEAVLKGLNEHGPTIVAELTTFLIGFIINSLDKIGDNLGDILDSLLKLVIKLLYGLGYALQENALEVGKAMGMIVREFVQAIFIGLVGMLAELLSWWPAAHDKILEFGENIKNAMNDSLEINSPSKMTKQMGKFLMQGLVVGMDEESDKTTAETVDIMTDCVNTALDTAQEIIDENDDSLVIKPVMDLSSIESGANQLSNIMSGVSGASVSANIASRASRDMTRSRNQNQIEASQTTVNNAGDTYNNTFNITTDDPEELAREVDEIMQRQHIRANLAKGGAR